MPCWCWEVLVKFVHFRFHLVLSSDADGSPLVDLRFDEEEHRVRPFHPCEVLQEVLERQVCFLFSPFPLDARLTLLRSTASTPPTGFSSVTATSTSWRSSALSSLSVRSFLFHSPSATLTFPLQSTLPGIHAVTSHCRTGFPTFSPSPLTSTPSPWRRTSSSSTTRVFQPEGSSTLRRRTSSRGRSSRRTS